MEFYEGIEKRRTIRDFESEDVPKEVFERIISAAMKAPTNDHMRDWHFIIVKDRETAARLLDIVPKGISDEDMNQLIKDWNLDDSLQQECYRNAVPKQYRMLFDASAIILPLLKQKTDILHPENISHLGNSDKGEVSLALKPCKCRSSLLLELKNLIVIAHGQKFFTHLLSAP